MADPTNTAPMAHSGGTDPSFSGAIVALMKALGQAILPNSATNRPTIIDQAAQQQVTGVPGPVPQVPRQSIGNQSPGLGQSF